MKNLFENVIKPVIELTILNEKIKNFAHGGLIPAGNCERVEPFIGRETVLTKKQQENLYTLANGGKPE